MSSTISASAPSSAASRFTPNRRQLLRGGTAAVAAALAHFPLSRFGFAALADDETVIPFLEPQPVDAKRPMIDWQALKDWITPLEQFFAVSHYGMPTLKAEEYKLAISGLVEKPLTLTLEEIKARPKQELIATLECSGNGASPRFMGAIGNARWGGTPLGPVLKEAGLKPEAIEVVFFSADEGTEKIREVEYKQNFARSLATKDALLDNVLLAYEMNGQPLEVKHGFPLRLVVPGWYGIAWIKWLNHIELHDRRYMSKFMARDYVTIRGEQHGERTIWRETSVGRMNVKSLVARVVRRKDGTVVVQGAAWSDGSALKSVELKIDDGDWRTATLDTSTERQAPYAWTFWSYEWKDAPAGQHTLVSRASDVAGRTQPAAEDPEIKLKRTYWEAYEQVPRKIELK